MTGANEVGNSNGSGSTGPGGVPQTGQDPFRLVEAFDRARRGVPSAGDLTALGIILVAFGLAPLGGAAFLGTSLRMWVALATSAVLIVAGEGFVVAAVRMNRKQGGHRWTKDGTQLSLDGHDQRASIDSIELPHGTKYRDVWLGVWVGGRCYPHPVRVLHDGTVCGCHLGLGEDADVGKRFRVVAYAIPREIAAPVEKYYERATRLGDYPGMVKKTWPDHPDVHELFAFSCVRKVPA